MIRPVTEPREPMLLDVRPVLAAGGDPLDAILAAAESLVPSQELVVVNSFEPFPLYDILESRGFDHRIERFPDGDWKVTFRRRPNDEAGAPDGA